MSTEQSVAPKERVNIVYKTQVGGAQAEMELPLKILMVGDYTGRKDETPLEERKPINIDKSNFNDVMAQQHLEVAVNVSNKLVEEKDALMDVKLQFKSLDDFTPEGVVRQVPELQKILELRQALTALKGPFGNTPAFRKKIEQLLSDEASRKKLMAEFGLADEPK